MTLYEAASGQEINLPKSEVYYRKSMNQPLHTSIKQILGVQAVLRTKKFLGPPPMIGSGKQETFGNIRVKNKFMEQQMFIEGGT